nr:hypothetical protein PBILCG01_0001800 [Plasmodium sp. DRC-Itaito]
MHHYVGRNMGNGGFILCDVSVLFINVCYGEANIEFFFFLLNYSRFFTLSDMDPRSGFKIKDLRLKTWDL